MTVDEEYFYKKKRDYYVLAPSESSLVVRILNTFKIFGKKEILIILIPLIGVMSVHCNGRKCIGSRKEG